jgi:hypothetical protein
VKVKRGGAGAEERRGPGYGCPDGAFVPVSSVVEPDVPDVPDVPEVPDVPAPVW